MTQALIFLIAVNVILLILLVDASKELKNLKSDCEMMAGKILFIIDKMTDGEEEED